MIASWVAAHFTAKAVGGVTVYDLTQKNSRDPAICHSRRSSRYIGGYRWGLIVQKTTTFPRPPRTRVRIEAEDPERWLVGFEFRCKGSERILEKVAVTFEEQPDLAPSDALASVKDAIRYTLQYTEEHYTEGVYTDIDRLRAEGSELIDLRNSWASEGYKG